MNECQITLESGGHQVTIPYSVAIQSITIREMINDIGIDQKDNSQNNIIPIPCSIIDGTILNSLAICMKCLRDNKHIINQQYEDNSSQQYEDNSNQQNENNSNQVNEENFKVDVALINQNKDKDLLYKLIIELDAKTIMLLLGAADYLNIPILTQYCGYIISSKYLSKKTVNQIKTSFNIK